MKRYGPTYDKSRRAHIIKVVHGERSLQIAYSPEDFKKADLVKDFEFLEEKLRQAEVAARRERAKGRNGKGR